MTLKNLRNRYLILASRFFISQSAKYNKYKFPKIQPIKFRDDITLRGVDDIKSSSFYVTGLQEKDMRHAKYLLDRLKHHAPVDTGRLRRSYNAYPYEVKPGVWVIAISNQSPYFKFAYFYYRGEIKQNHSFIKDFVADAVRDMVNKIPPSTVKLPKPPKLPEQGKISKPKVVRKPDDVKEKKGAKRDRIDIDEVLKETDKAVLVKDQLGNKVWLPKSQIEIEDKSILMPKWLQKKTYIGKRLEIPIEEVLVETEKAIQVRLLSIHTTLPGRKVWLPKSQIKKGKGERGEEWIEAPLWLVDDKDLW
jgi:hypothetical protein